MRLFGSVVWCKKLLSEYLIVDGYNIINAWPELKKLKEENLEHARVKLAEILINYHGVTKTEVLLVYDAHLVKGGREYREKLLGVEVVYTREEETADMFIERCAGELALMGRVFVATSDWIEQSVILQRGALRISARELYKEVITKLKQNYVISKKGEDKFGKLQHFLSEDMWEIMEKWRRSKYEEK